MDVCLVPAHAKKNWRYTTVSLNDLRQLVDGDRVVVRFSPTLGCRYLESATRGFLAGESENPSTHSRGEKVAS